MQNIAFSTKKYNFQNIYAKKVELCRSQFSVLIQKGNQEKVGENERRDANDNDN